MINQAIKKLPRLRIRPATISDLEKVIQLDSRITQIQKSQYWSDVFTRSIGQPGHYFLVTESALDKRTEGSLIGFIVGEVRAWEFGSEPCGWVVTILVSPNFQGLGVGEILFTSICSAMKEHGVKTIRTMIARKDNLNMSFFRSQGMRAGPFLELEMSLTGDI